jgi:Spx/MgsR family transcriptional regulator
MKTVELYGLKKCSTCLKATAWLDRRHIGYRFIDYRDHPADPALLRAWADALGGWEKLVNRASMTWRNLPADRKAPAAPEEWLALIAEFPALIKRPVAVDASGAVNAGFSEKKYEVLFG